MAQLKDSVVQGSLRVTDTTYTTNLNLSSGTASQIVKTDANKNLITGALAASEIPNLSASKITSDTLSADRIPNLAASKINSGTFDAARIPNLSATKITSDTLSVDRIPNLSANKITADTFNVARIPTLSIIDKTSGTLTVARGGTNLTSITQGGVIYAASTTAYGSTAAGASGQYLKSNGTSAPTWETFSNSTVGLGNVTNDKQIKASIGTAKGDMIYFTGDASPARLAIGTAGYTLQATANGPAWTQTVAVANGGTGATSFTANCAILSGSTTTGAFTTRAITNNTTAGSNPTADTNLITANTLMNYAGTSNINTTGTVTSGVWSSTISYGRKANTSVGTGSFAYGYNVTASSSYSHAEGSQTTASGQYSHAEGYYTTASGWHSHAEGFYTTVSGTYSHAEGGHTVASNIYTHAQGYYTIADARYVSAAGRYNSSFENNQAAVRPWVRYNTYHVGELAYAATQGSNNKYYLAVYECLEDHMAMTDSLDEQQEAAKWTPILTDSTTPYDSPPTDFKYFSSLSQLISVIGIGSSTTIRKNGQAIDRDGNEHLYGYVYVKANENSKNGINIAPLTLSSPIVIPSEGTSTMYVLRGLTSNYVVAKWNFNESAENTPPASLTITTTTNSFTITNNGGTTSETVKPIFIQGVSLATS